MLKELRQRLSWRTSIRVTIWDLEGSVKEEWESHNLITAVGLNMVRDLLEGLIADGELKYMAVGNDNTPPVLADTTLGNETFRKAVTAFSEPGTGQLKTTVYLAPAEAVGLIEELGWFAGAGALPWPGGINTGILVGRVLYNRTKTNLESIQCERTDRCEEA